MNARGFTLLEMALVILIVGALAGAALGPLQIQREQRARRATTAALDHAIEALYGFALSHGRLPCPDRLSAGDGREDRADGEHCVISEGALPHVELGVTGHDAWGNRLRYRLSAATPSMPAQGNFAASDDGICSADDDDLDLCERGELEIRTRGNNPATSTLEAKFAHVLADAVPAVVLSHGANGHGAVGGDGTLRAPVPAGHLDERENADGDALFFARTFSAERAACSDDDNEAFALCAYDDLVRWISPTILNSRLVSAGRLP